MELTPLVEEI